MIYLEILKSCVLFCLGFMTAVGFMIWWYHHDDDDNDDNIKHV